MSKPRCQHCDSDRVVETGRTGYDDAYMKVWYKCKSCGEESWEYEDNRSDG